MNSYSQKIDKSQEQELKVFFEKDGAVISLAQNAVWRAKTAKYSATLYHTGKLLVQGAEVSDIAAEIQKLCGCSPVQTGAPALDGLDIPVCHAGTDESGKGDFFGPLVIDLAAYAGRHKRLQKSGRQKYFQTRGSDKKQLRFFDCDD